MYKSLKLTSIALLVAGSLVACSSSDDDDGNNTDNSGAGNGGSTGGSGSFEQPEIYTGFPVTQAGATGESSTSYSGQMARHVLREQAKATLKAPTASGYAVIEEVNRYLANPDNVVDELPIIAPASAEGFTFLETVNNELGTERNLTGKLFDPGEDGDGDPISGVDPANAKVTMGWPGDKTAEELLKLWVDYFGAISAGSVPVDDATTPHVDTAHGYDYSQLVPKFLMGAVFYNQSVDKYLDENMSADTKPNNEPYKPGANFTGKEHSWDEGFGYFGAAANYGKLTAQQNYDVSKIKGADAAANADWNNDGKVSLYTEYTSGAARYAASFDKDGKSTYGKTIMDAFLEGRTIIANATDESGVARALTEEERNQLLALAATIHENWEHVFAEAVFKYAGESYEEIEKIQNGTGSNADYYGAWSELKGFVLALQFGGPNSTMTKALLDEIDGLVGYGPVLPDGKQVNGLELVAGSGGAPDREVYTFSEGNSLDDYKAKMLQVQTRMDEIYTLKAKQHDNREGAAAAADAEQQP
ncbi:MAG: hypothetical protein CSB44_07485 [Gammaproteobacteria bacterium]|nr:MAG: hypothetical protein CSB44_07485 [Gammaproteobacteria bacterium]